MNRPNNIDKIKKLTTEILCELIKINTANPPGNELEAAKYIADVLEDWGLQAEVLISKGRRGNVISRIEGKRKKPSLLLLSHLDVVPAKTEEWSVDPFSGIVKDGFVWGRGAIDCKSLVVVEAAVLKLIAESGVKPIGDLIFAATADEEKGGKAGVGWLIEKHLEKIKADYVINEGGGFSLPIRGKHIFTVQTAEKGVNWFKIKAYGTPGHGSVPGVADNAITRMSEILKKIGGHKPKIIVTPTVKIFIRKLAEVMGYGSLSFLLTNTITADIILDFIARKDKALAESLRAMLRMTMAPTIVKGGVKENVIPSSCETVIDCRTLPGQTVDDIIEEVKKILKGIKMWEIEFISRGKATESPINTPLFKVIEETLKQYVPNCLIVPYMSTGGTDSRYFREIGSVCYGFQPIKTDLDWKEFIKMIHGVDERISIENLMFGVKVLYDVVKRMLFNVDVF